MRIFLAVAVIAAGLAGCQTTEQSRANATDNCAQSGLRPGSRAHSRCVAAQMRQDQRTNEAIAGAVVAGAAAGLVGAAIVANDRPYYGRRYYRRGYYCDGFYC